MKKLIISLLITALHSYTAYASNVFIYDQSDNTYVDYKESVETSQYKACVDCLINPDVSSVSGVSTDFWIHDSGKVREMSDAEKDLLRLPAKISEKKALVDLDVKQKLSNGFSYDGKMFSVLNIDDISWNSLEVAKTARAFPVTVKTKDGELYFLNTLEELDSFYSKVIVQAIKGHHNDGVAQKAIYDQCDTYRCIDLCEVQACVDCEDAIDPDACFEAYEPRGALNVK